MKTSSRLSEARKGRTITVSFRYSDDDGDVEEVTVFTDSFEDAKKKAIASRSDKRKPIGISIYDPLLDPDFYYNNDGAPGNDSSDNADHFKK